MKKNIKYVKDVLSKISRSKQEVKEKLFYSDPENLGSCITGEWRQNDDQKDN